MLLLYYYIVYCSTTVFRFSLLFVWFWLQRLIPERVTMAERCEYEYDVCVVCADSIKKWAEEYLIPQVLTGRWRLRVMREAYDFEPGRPIAEEW